MELASCVIRNLVNFWFKMVVKLALLPFTFCNDPVFYKIYGVLDRKSVEKQVYLHVEKQVYLHM